MSSETFHTSKPETARPPDFGAPPPEINSGELHCGPGSAPLKAAAAAWAELATALFDAAKGYRLAPTLPEAHLVWLDTTAAQARCAAAQADAAAAAVDSALAATAGPRRIATNRARRTSLAARNVLGQNTPAIAELEAAYERMWVRDARAMRSYAAASAEACSLAPFCPPAPDGAPAAATGDWALTAAPQIITAGARLMSAIPEALRGLTSAPAAPIRAALSPATTSLSKLSSLCAPSDSAIARLNSLNKAAAVREAAALQTLTPSIARPKRAATTAFGQATAVGALSVPPAWSSSEPLSAPTESTAAWGYRVGLHLVSN